MTGTDGAAGAGGAGHTGGTGVRDSAGDPGGTGGRRAPRALRALPGTVRRAGLAHLQTWRPYTLAYPGLVGLAGASLTGGTGDGARLLVAWSAPTLGWLSGHYLGDWFDRHLDALSKPQRPIPSGRLSPRAAVAFGTACAVAAAGAAATADWRAVLLVALAVTGIVAYSRLLKGRGLSGNAVRGALTATTVVFGAMVADSGPLPPWQVAPFALAFWSHDTASNLVGTLRDVDGDRAGGYRTLPVRRGVRYAARAAALLYAAALAAAALGAALLLSQDPPGEDAAVCLALLACAGACGAYAFLPLLRGSVPCSAPRALRAHEVLVAERLVLTGAPLAGGWGAAPALAVLGPLLTLSVVTQAGMRARHEFPAPPEDPGGHLRATAPQRCPHIVPQGGAGPAEATRAAGTAHGAPAVPEPSAARTARPVPAPASASARARAGHRTAREDDAPSC